MGNDFDKVSYSHYFVAKNVDWQEVRLLFRDFVPTYRGRILESFQSLDSQEIMESGTNDFRQTSWKFPIWRLPG